MKTCFNTEMKRTEDEGNRIFLSFRVPRLIRIADLDSIIFEEITPINQNSKDLNGKYNIGTTNPTRIENHIYCCLIWDLFIRVHWCLFVVDFTSFRFLRSY